MTNIEEKMYIYAVKSLIKEHNKNRIIDIITKSLISLSNGSLFYCLPLFQCVK